MAKQGPKKKYHLFTKCGNKYYNVNTFMSKIEEQPTGCHHWIGPKHVQKYGMCGGVYVDTDQRFMTVTHRAAMEIHLGRHLLPGENVIHKVGCEPCCVNPAHLQIGDLRLRNAVMVANGNAGLGRRGASNLPPKKQKRNYRWTEDEIRRIRDQPTDVTATQFGWTRQKASKMRWEMRQRYKWLK